MTQPTIAVIDDDRLVRATLEAFLNDAGYQVSLAANATEGLRAIAEGHVELVITDILMPDRNGFDAIRDIRRHHPNIKIIAISGAMPANGAAFVDMVGSLGANRVLAKPFTSDQLIVAVEGLLRH